MVKKRPRKRGISDAILTQINSDVKILEYIKLHKKTVSATRFATMQNIKLSTLRKAISGENNSQNAVQLRLCFLQHIVNENKQKLDKTKKALKLIQNAD